MKLEYTRWKFPLGLGRVEFWLQLAGEEPCLVKCFLRSGLSDLVFGERRSSKREGWETSRNMAIFPMFEVSDCWQDPFKSSWHWKHVEIWPSLALKKAPFGCVFKLWYGIWLEKKGDFSWAALPQPCTPRKLRAKMKLSPWIHPFPIAAQSGGSHSYSLGREEQLLQIVVFGFVWVRATAKGSFSSQERTFYFEEPPPALPSWPNRISALQMT